MSYEHSNTQSYIACGQMFSGEQNDAVLISIIKKYEELKSQRFQKSGMKECIVEDVDIPAYNCRISYLFSGNIVQIGIIDNQSNEFYKTVDPNIFRHISSSYVFKSTAVYEPPTTTDIASYRAWGREIVHRRERGIVLTPAVEATGNKKKDAMANRYLKNQEKRPPYGSIDADLHTIKRYKSTNTTEKKIFADMSGDERIEKALKNHEDNAKGTQSKDEPTKNDRSDSDSDPTNR